MLTSHGVHFGVNSDRERLTAAFVNLRQVIVEAGPSPTPVH